MYAQRLTVSVTTDGSGNATAFSDVVTGRIISITYTKDGTNPYSSGVDFTITAEATGETIWAENDVNATATRAPRQATHTTAGVASLYAAGGTAVTDHVVVASDRVKIVIGSGGAAKIGTFSILVA